MEKVLSEVSNDGALKDVVTESWSDTCISRKRATRDVWFRLLGYQRILSRLNASINADVTKKYVGTRKVSEKALGSRELEMSW